MSSAAREYIKKIVKNRKSGELKKARAARKNILATAEKRRRIESINVGRERMFLLHPTSQLTFELQIALKRASRKPEIEKQIADLMDAGKKNGGYTEAERIRAAKLYGKAIVDRI